MTREEAIKILKSKMDGSVDTSYEWAEAVRMAIKALKQPKSCWIPCSERLPEEKKDILICFKDGRDCPWSQIQVGHLGEHEVEDNDFREIGKVKVWYTDRFYYIFDKVIAWMPLPQPYKGD